MWKMRYRPGEDLHALVLPRSFNHSVKPYRTSTLFLHSMHDGTVLDDGLPTMIVTQTVISWDCSNIDKSCDSLLHPPRSGPGDR